MKTANLFKVICLLFSLGLLTQCEKNGIPGGGMPDPNEDSDRPSWAGGDTDANEHIKGNDESGTTRGGDYGDLFVLKRDLNGVPVMLELNEVDEEGFPTGETFFVVQPVGVDGETLELDAEGELTEASLLLAQPVEFGRLNIVRSPQSVLDQALAEALKVINAGVAFSVDFCGRLTIWNFNPEVPDELIITKTIDSPRESMALYQEIMNNGFDGQLTALRNSGIDQLMLAASSFAAGSDKTGTVNIDEVVYINGFINCLGDDPIVNVNEFSFNSDVPKEYFRFGPDDDMPGANMFEYNRTNTYQHRYIRMLVLNPDNTYSYQTVSILAAMEDRGLFMYRWEGDAEDNLNMVDGFAAASDDAVQVLEFIHGDSNIEFLPVVPEI
jgi:hypothetical protein